MERDMIEKEWLVVITPFVNSKELSEYIHDSLGKHIIALEVRWLWCVLEQIGMKDPLDSPQLAFRPATPAETHKELAFDADLGVIQSDIGVWFRGETVYLAKGRMSLS